MEPRPFRPFHGKYTVYEFSCHFDENVCIQLVRKNKASCSENVCYNISTVFVFLKTFMYTSLYFTMHNLTYKRRGALTGLFTHFQAFSHFQANVHVGNEVCLISRVINVVSLSWALS